MSSALSDPFVIGPVNLPLEPSHGPSPSEVTVAVFASTVALSGLAIAPVTVTVTSKAESPATLSGQPPARPSGSAGSASPEASSERSGSEYWHVIVPAFSAHDAPAVVGWVIDTNS